MEGQAPKTVAREIADLLGETYRGPRWRISQIVHLCGVDFAQDILQQTLEVESSGGMLTNKGDRRRTPGGVFLRLAKDQMDAESRSKIFPPTTWKERKRRDKARQQQLAAQEAGEKDQEPQTGSVNATPAARVAVSISPEAQAHLQQLQSAAAVLREKLAAMEAGGQRAGLEMTRKVLDKTERQIAALEGQHTRMG